MLRTSILAVLAALATIAFAPSTRAQEALEMRAQQIARQVLADPKVDEAWFDERFLAKVSASKLAEIMKDLHRQHGASTSMVQRGRDSDFGGRYDMTLEKDVVVPVTITLQQKPPHAIVGLWFGVPTAALKDFDAVVAELAKLPGRTGLSCVEIVEGDPKDREEIAGAGDAGGPKVSGWVRTSIRSIAQKDDDQPFAIGSAFKLYVLGALAAEVESGKRKIADVVQLETRNMSLPSGRMHTWPAGSPVTLATLATAMISESDNTATDHLIAAVGRGACESALVWMRNSAPEKNRPFLTTREMFQLKLTRGGEMANTYAKLDEAGRRKLLEKDLSGGLSVSDVDLSLMAAPSHIDTIEWFASPRDMVVAMNALRLATGPSKKAQGLRDVLSVNPGIPALKDAFEWVGFKGGSETGVIALSFLLKSKDGRWFALSAAWNDPSAAVDDGKFVALIGRAGALLARHPAK